MKYLLVLAVVALAFWLWRNSRKNAKLQQKKAAPTRPVRDVPLGAPQPMLRCAACGVHLPTADAVVGKRGSYCTSAHLSQREG
jgi:uncharacterized protein